MKFTVQQFLSFTEQFEGKVPTMYRDRENLVTVGYGNLIEPIQLAWGLKWLRDGRPATQSEVIEEWNLVNDAPDLDRLGWRAARDLKRPGGASALYLSEETMVGLVASRLASNEDYIKQGFPGYDQMCADLQLFLHSMAWACGALFWKAGGRGYPRLRKLVNDGKLDAATVECGINPKVGTIILRNSANIQLLMNANRINVRSKMTGDAYLNPDVLMYPGLGAPEGSPAHDVDHTVAGIQHALGMLGFKLFQDGIMGPLTIDAIKKFQAIHKLKVDGIVGPVTYSALHDALRYR